MGQWDIIDSIDSRNGHIPLNNAKSMKTLFSSMELSSLGDGGSIIEDRLGEWVKVEVIETCGVVDEPRDGSDSIRDDGWDDGREIEGELDGENLTGERERRDIEDNGGECVRLDEAAGWWENDCIPDVAVLATGVGRVNGDAWGVESKTEDDRLRSLVERCWSGGSDNRWLWDVESGKEPALVNMFEPDVEPWEKRFSREFCLSSFCTRRFNRNFMVFCLKERSDNERVFQVSPNTYLNRISSTLNRMDLWRQTF